MKTRDLGTPRLFADTLREILDAHRGSHTGAADAFGIAPQGVYQMLLSEKANPMEKVAQLHAELRERGNPLADQIIIRLAQHCGFIAYRNSVTSADDADFAAAMKEFSELIATRCEAGMDGRMETSERRANAKAADEAAQRILAYRDKQNAIADAEEKQPRVLNVRSIR